MTAKLGDITYPTPFSELELRICPAALLQATQRDAMSKIFEEALHGLAPTNADPLYIPRFGTDNVIRFTPPHSAPMLQALDLSLRAP